MLELLGAYFHPDDGGNMFLPNVISNKPHGITSERMAFSVFDTQEYS
jgi:hypothetical protein